jgi:hypothetical protein
MATSKPEVLTLSIMLRDLLRLASGQIEHPACFVGAARTKFGAILPTLRCDNGLTE